MCKLAGNCRCHWANVHKENIHTHTNSAGQSIEAQKVLREFSLKPCTWENLTENEWDEVEKKGKKRRQEKDQTPTYFTYLQCQRCPLKPQCAQCNTRLQ